MDTSTTPSQLVHTIRKNWSIPPSDPHLIPPSLLAGLTPSHISPPLLSAIHRLSTLTFGQRDRAYNLLNTYYQARKRERGEQQAGGGMLEVGDVEKACGSARKMSCVGLGVEQRACILGVEAMREGGKGGMWGRGESVRESVEEVGVEVEVSLVQKRRVELAPIVTMKSCAPAVAVAEGEGEVLSSFTPLFRRLQDELGGGAGGSAGLGLDGQQQGVELPEGEKGEGSGSWDTEKDVSAAQRAMHEFNVRRLEMEGKKREYEDAVWRFEEARWRMESVKGGRR
ncbi:hypothetical protein COCMIDRAFT_104554 [Bipolaris oryzae ATCC 44560]|uniref:Uncharacterized protein n=1 Tax=Bipolaris oryzae ATCC 44560 TaxID=930090 RepID=W6YWX5_COCMI|nr:uncharacterized protein COCMIDRAFT_104554 [Bipolaris oryzae ATCC 44560]EUC42055.1 hypothetical protein COCMIDRAFT_104554 [Bipolaris oryzae ATCC 44560]